MNQYPGFTSLTARDLEDGYAVRMPGRERYVSEVERVTKRGALVDIIWTDGTSIEGVHGNTFVQVQVW